ncbi:Serine-threonine kinase receptor-associated protein [Hordeum vulgare]|nr:Serine-threonine kinase receptor-associated protein [Hordeum vulgare]
MGGVSGKIVQTLETKAPVTSAEVSQDGRFITTDDGSSVKFWDANHFGLVKSYDMSCTVESASLEPKSGSKIIAGGEDMLVHVYDFFTGEEIGWDNEMVRISFPYRPCTENLHSTTPLPEQVEFLLKVAD